ncbi:MAG TPA: tetratricopeptide repeat protein [Stellaceae bacterium]|nr:tetratricopeptide repeat protein [Stellaceae bacterium]
MMRSPTARGAAGWWRAAGLIGLCAAVVAGAPASYGQAAGRLTQALAAAEAQHGKTSPALLPLIERLAQADWRDGALDAAAVLRRRALAIAIAAFGCDSPRAAAAMTALARLDIDRRRYLDAEPLLIIAGQVAGAPEMASIAAGRARIALARGRTAHAETWARKAVALAGRQPVHPGAEPWRVLGAVLTAAEHFAAAEPILREALAQDRKQHDADAVATARSLSQLGNLYLRWGRAREALPQLEEAAAIDQQRLGPTHPFLADDLYDLGQAYEALQRRGEARLAFRAAIDILRRGGGRDTPRFAYCEIELSRLERQRGDTAAAQAASRDARRILDQAADEEHRREGKA